MFLFAEDFVTPSSTPPNEKAEDDVEDEKKEDGDNKTTNLSDLFSELSDVALHDKIYDK